MHLGQHNQLKLNKSACYLRAVSLPLGVTYCHGIFTGFHSFQLAVKKTDHLSRTKPIHKGAVDENGGGGKKAREVVNQQK